jgi:hypothetical protein
LERQGGKKGNGMNELQNKYVEMVNDVSANDSNCAAKLLENYFHAARKVGNGALLYKKLEYSTRSNPQTQKKVLTFFITFCKDHKITFTEFST